MLNRQNYINSAILVFLATLLHPVTVVRAVPAKACILVYRPFNTK